MLTQVQIKNYKSLGDVTVHLDPVTVLIGQSGSGKTNFVEALRWLRDCLTSRNEHTLVQQFGGWGSIMSCTAATPAVLTFDVTFTTLGIVDSFHYLLSFAQESPRHAAQFIEESLHIGKKTLFHQSKRRWIEPPGVPSPPQPGSIALGTINGLQEDTVAYLCLTKNIGCYSFPDNVLARSDNPAPRQNQGLADNGANFLEVLSAINDNLGALHHPRNIVASMQGLKGSVKAIDLIKPDNQQVYVRHQIDNHPISFELRQESEGFRRLLACLIALYQEPSKQTVVFDEPEKGIYPAGLEILAEEFKGYANNGRGQVILTTHSPEFLNHFAPEQIRVVEMQNYQTRIGPVSPEQMEALREHYLEAKELLTVDEARLQGTLAEGQ